MIATTECSTVTATKGCSMVTARTGGSTATVTMRKKDDSYNRMPYSDSF